MTLIFSRKTTLKRKKAQNAGSAQRKRPRKDSAAVNDLPWKKISRPNAIGFEGDEGILELEEVDDVEITYEETENGKVARFKVLEKNEEAEDGDKSNEESESGDEPDSLEEEEVEFDADTLLPKWLPYSLHPRILKSLHSQGFQTPTPIQEKTLPAALKGKDVVGVAETGSGKTLAYGLPILHDIINRNPRSTVKKVLQALVLAPTRELALQVVAHLNACILPSSSSSSDGLTSKRPIVSIAAIVGGMAMQKQRRIIDRGVDIIVGTPGRLWEFIQEDDDLAEQIKGIRYLVLDEADRMIETGHFAELDNIVRLTTRDFKNAFSDPDFGKSAPEELNNSENAEEQETEAKDPQMQTFVFSATLSKDLQQNLKRRLRSALKVRAKQKKLSTLDELLEKLDFRDPEPEIIDLSPEGGVVSTLKESRVECLSADKDVYLYYFLLRYPGRSLVFLSSIDGIRRLLPLCELLQLKAYPLHSQLQQRQRLKNLDRFKATARSVLLATDVAARGLDIPAVDHVIHYQIPRSTDVYVHRNGRTARARREGFSLLMVAPDERRVVRALLGSLGRVGENEIPEMPFEIDLLDKLKHRVQVAKKIDTMQHRSKKEKHEKNWLKEAAEAMEIELDSDLDEKNDGEDAPRTKHKNAGEAKEVQALKAELKHLLSQPLVASGVMKKYITSGARSVVAQLLDSNESSDILGFKKGNALNHLTEGQGGKRKPKKLKAEAVQQEEEWAGFDS